MITQPDLKLFPGERPLREPDPNIAYLVAILQGRDWTTAKEIIELVFSATQVRWHDRKVRELAAASRGVVIGGQRGYKLQEMATSEEYNHWRNWMSSQADEMKRRVIEADRIFYARKTVKVLTKE